MLIMPDGKPSTYNPTPMGPQTQAPQYTQTNTFRDKRNRITNQIMDHPESLDQTWQDQQNEQNKESAMRMASQQKGQYQQTQASRGFNPNGRAQQAVLGGIDQGMTGQILQGRRDVSQRAAQTNMQDRYNAANLGHTFDQQDNQLAQGIMQGNFGMQMQQNQSDLQKWQAMEQARQFQATLGSNNWLEQARLAMQGDQFGQSMGLNWANFGENQRQFNQQMGFNWNQAGQNNMNNFLQYLSGGNG